MKPGISLILWAFLLNSVNTLAQNPARKEITSAVTIIANLIEKNYVFASKGKIIAQHLLQEHKKGTFDSIKDWQMLGDKLTTSLRSFSNDGHLYVRYDTGKVKELLEASKEETETASSKQPGYDPFYFGTAAIEKNFGFREIRILDGNIGYIKLSEINISGKSLPVLYAAMQFIANTKALIIDLRGNGGGGSDVGCVLESFFLPGNIPLLEFKTRNGTSQLDKTVTWLTQKKYDHPLFIIVNKETASAAEAFAFALQNNRRAIIIGQQSAGAANMNSWYIVNEYLYLSVSTAAPTIPGTEKSWEQKGVQPDHIVESGKEIGFIQTLLKKGGNSPKPHS